MTYSSPDGISVFHEVHMRVFRWVEGGLMWVEGELKV